MSTPAELPEKEGPMTEDEIVAEAVGKPEPDPSHIHYVNAYAVSRNYGGPEEGGWWYDSGRPLASIPIGPDEDSELHFQRLKTLLGWEKNPSQGRYSVNGGEDFEMWVEDHFAAPYPTETPHYE